MANTTLTQFPAGQTQYRINFDYLARPFVVVTLVNSTDASQNKVLTIGNDYTFLGPTLISISADQTGYDIVQIHRFTSTELVVSFRDGSVLTAKDLTNAELQAIHIAEEGRDQTVDLAKQYADQAVAAGKEAEELLESVIGMGLGGFTVKGSFENGGTLNGELEVLQLGSGTGISHWKWNGSFPKVVPAGSTPDSTGGIGPTAWEAIQYVPLNKEYTFSSLSEALAATMPVDSVAKVGSKVYKVKTPSTVVVASVPSLTKADGLVLVPVSGFARTTVSAAGTYTVETGTPEMVENTNRSMQGVFVDAVANTVIYAFNVPGTDLEGGELYEYAFNRETGKPGAFIRKVTGIPMGHADYFCVVRDNGVRKLLFSEPIGPLWASGYYISAVNWDAADPSTTKVRLLDFTSEGPRALITAAGNDVAIHRVGKSLSYCDPADVLAGVFKPKSSIGWQSVSDMADMTIPQQNIQCNPEHGVIWGLSGYDNRFPNANFVSTGFGGYRTSTLVLPQETDNAKQSELECLCWYWRDSDQTYQPYVILWDVKNYHPVILNVHNSESDGPKPWSMKNFKGDYSQWQGDRAFLYSPVGVAVNGLAIGGQTFGTKDTYNPADFMLEQWSNNTTRRGVRIQYRPMDSGSNGSFTQVLFDDTRDTIFGVGIRFAINDGTKTWPVMSLKAGKAFIGLHAQKADVTGYYGKLNLVAGDGVDSVGIYTNTSSGKPQWVTGSGGATLATSSGSLRFGAWANATETFTQWLAITSTGYTWNVPATSARKLKDDIEPITESGLDVVKKMVPSAYTWKETGERRWGFIADEAANAHHMLANVDEKGEATGIWDMAHIAILAKAIQELSEALDKSRQETNNLKAVLLANGFSL